MTFIPETKELRRFHLSDKDVQEPLYQAVRKARINKRVTTHTFRHSFTPLEICYLFPVAA